MTNIAENLNAILKKDPVLYDRLYEMSKGEISELAAQRVFDKLNQKRVLDKPPTTFKLNTENGIQSGCKAFFKHFYNTLELSENESKGHIRFVTVDIYCDTEVVKVLKTLITIGTCKDEDLSSICRELVTDIIKPSVQGIALTKKYLLTHLDGSGYYEQSLIEAIKEVLSE